MGFVHLHTHSYFSLLAGLASPEDLVRRAAELGQSALALTDFNNMFGAVRFYRAARAAGMKPIFGLQLAVGPTRHVLTLLAETEQGYRHLMKLATAVRSERSRSAPSASGPTGSVYGEDGTVSGRLLFKWGEGLIVLSGGPRGRLHRLVAAGQLHDAQQFAANLRDRFGRDNFFIELQHHKLPGQSDVNESLFSIAREVGVGVVATNDVRYVHAADAAAHGALLALGARTTLRDARRPSMGSSQFFLTSEDEMRARFPALEEALANTVVIADRCRVDLPTKRRRLPVYRAKSPPTSGIDEAELGEETGTAEKLLARRAWAGARKRYFRGPRHGSEGASATPPRVQARLEHELDVICRRGLASYFLIVADIVQAAKERGIRVGPGRGSAASSLTAYCLGITDVDPLAYGLVFERFLNPERIGVPDIDIDVSDVGRDELLDYIRCRFGPEHVAHIVTFGTLAPRAAVREAGRLLDPSPAGRSLSRGDAPGACPTQRYQDAADRIVGLLSEPGLTLEQAAAASPELQRLLRTDAEAAQLFALAKAIEGVPRHVSIHAAGIVISDKPLHDDMPLMVTAEGVRITQYPMDGVEALGFLKMDVLGLRTLSVIDRAWRWIAKSRPRRGRGGSPGDAFELYDEAVYAGLRRHGTDGVFQLETPMFQQMVRRWQPTTFDDIVALLALGRPGPGQRIDEFIGRRRGRLPVRFTHPALEPILRETYGIIVYQEQVMHIAMQVAGYSAADADLLRRRLTDVGGGGSTLSEEEREKFVRGAADNGLSRAEAERVLGELTRLAGYGFAKSHSVAYGMLTYETAWLRTYYPAAFLASLLNAHLHSPARVARYVKAARTWGVHVHRPDVNESPVEFEPVDGDEPAVRYGLAGVRHVGRGGAEAVVRARVAGPFRSFDDLRHRLPPAHRRGKLLEALIRSGACDGFGAAREHMLALIGPGLSTAQGAVVPGQGALFAAGAETPGVMTAGAGPVNDSDTIEESSSIAATMLVLRLAVHDRSALSALQHLLSSHKGRLPVQLELPVGGVGHVAVAVGPDFWVEDSPAFREKLQNWIREGKLTASWRVS